MVYECDVYTMEKHLPDAIAVSRGPWFAIFASPGALFLLSSLLVRWSGGAAANVA